MANVREQIVVDDDPTEMLTQLEKDLGDGAGDIMGEALQAKSVEDGRTLLMHAAASGNARWVLQLAEETRGRVSVASMI